MRCNGDPARNSHNNLKMAAFICKSDITKPISDYGKMLKYWENDISVNLIMSDVNEFCACGSVHVNWGRESREPRTLSGPVYTWSHHAFALVRQLSDREKTSPPNS